MNAIVVLAFGERYIGRFNQTFRPSIERYARDMDIDLIMITEFLRPLESKNVAWQKLLVFGDHRLDRYDRVLTLDADIYMTKHAKNIFDSSAGHDWAICKSNPYDIPEIEVTDLVNYSVTPKDNQPPFSFNCGIHVTSRVMKDELEKVYRDYVGKDPRDFDTGPITHYLYNRGGGVILDPEFNTPVALWVRKHGCSLSSVLRMYDQASFLHFVANKWQAIFLFIRWFDNTKNKPLKKLLRKMATPRWDPLTERLFRLFQRLVGWYSHRRGVFKAFEHRLEQRA